MVSMAGRGRRPAAPGVCGHCCWIVDFSLGVGFRTLYMPDLTMQGGWVAVRSALNLGAPRAARAQGGGWVVLCRSVLYRCTGMGLSVDQVHEI